MGTAVELVGQGFVRSQIYPDLGLSPAQDVAVEALAVGATYTDAAKAAGVSRKTLWEWRQESIFQAAINRLRNEIRESSRRRLERIAQKALGTVEQALDNGDAGTALVVLKGLGMLPGVSPSKLEEDFFEIDYRRNLDFRCSARYRAEQYLEQLRLESGEEE